MIKPSIQHVLSSLVLTIFAALQPGSTLAGDDFQKIERLLVRPQFAASCIGALQRGFDEKPIGWVDEKHFDATIEFYILHLSKNASSISLESLRRWLLVSWWETDIAFASEETRYWLPYYRDKSEYLAMRQSQVEAWSKILHCQIKADQIIRLRDDQ